MGGKSSISMDGHSVGSVVVTRNSNSPSSSPLAAANDIAPAQRAAIRAIGGSETDFDRREAYSEKYNQAGNNANVKRYGPGGGDYGYYQMNQALDVPDAIARGVPPAMAANLAGGGPGGAVPLEAQTAALHEYLKRKYPEYNNLANGGDFESFRKAAMHQWFGLSRDQGKPARQYYDETMKNRQ